MTCNDNAKEAPALPQTFNLLDTLCELDPRALQVERTVGDGLILRSPQIGEVRGVTVKACFPVTKPDRFLSFTGPEGGEIGMLEGTGELSAESRQALSEELAKQQFLPIITKINAVSTDFQVPIWDVLTDHGPRQLKLRSAHDVHYLEDGRVYLRDAEGNGYVIPDYNELDPASRDLLEFSV